MRIHRALVLALSIGFSPVAVADDAASEGNSAAESGKKEEPKVLKNDPASMNATLREDWRKVYWKGRDKVRKSMIIGGVGVAVAGGGALIMAQQSAEGEAAQADGDVGGTLGAGFKAGAAGLFMVIPGTLTAIVSGGMAAGASARSHRGLKKMGYTGELPYYSYLAWGTLLTPLFIEGGALEVLFYPASFGFSVLQVHRDKKMYEAGVKKYEPNSRLHINVAPIASSQMTGLGVQGAF